MDVPKILLYGNELLTQKCEDITDITKEDISSISQMIATLYAFKSFGFAAPQIGLLKNIIVYDIGWFKTKEKFKTLKIMFNPKITWESVEDVRMTEVCLSFPSIEADIYRPKDIEVSYFDKDMKEIKEKLTGVEARIVQHEIDHLSGILFTDRMSKSEKEKSRRILSIIKNHSKECSE